MAISPNHDQFHFQVMEDMLARHGGASPWRGNIFRIRGFNDSPRRGHKCHGVAVDFEETLDSRVGPLFKGIDG